MRTLIFSTKEEAVPIQSLLGGTIFSVTGSPEIPKYLDDNEDAVAIVIGDVLLMGWCTYHATSIIFSKNYTTDERIRTQAKSRVRYHPRLKDFGE